MENTTNQPDEKGHDANIVLAVSGLTFNDIIETLTEALREINQYEYGQGERYENETFIKVHTVREALKAACASSGEAQGVSVDYRSKYEKAIKVIKRFDAGIITMYDL
jgi:hypothetical protein